MKYTPYGCITQATLCGLSPHGELALQANARLTPYLKLGGCASALLMAVHRVPTIDYEAGWLEREQRLFEGDWRAASA